MTMVSWLMATSKPRQAGGAISEMYIGEMLEARPMLMPPRMRQVTNAGKLCAKAIPIEESTKIAAANTIKEEQRLPNVSRTMAEEVEEQRKAVEAERKLELKNSKTMSGGAYNTPMPTNAPSDQLPQPQVQTYDFFKPVAPNAPVIPTDNNNAAPPP